MGNVGTKPFEGAFEELGGTRGRREGAGSTLTYGRAAFARRGTVLARHRSFPTLAAHRRSVGFQPPIESLWRAESKLPGDLILRITVEAFCDELQVPHVSPIGLPFYVHVGVRPRPASPKSACDRASFLANFRQF
jgi:hypothetical protein